MNNKGLFKKLISNQAFVLGLAIASAFGVGACGSVGLEAPGKGDEVIQSPSVEPTQISESFFWNTPRGTTFYVISLHPRKSLDRAQNALLKVIEAFVWYYQSQGPREKFKTQWAVGSTTQFFPPRVHTWPDPQGANSVIQDIQFEARRIDLEPGLPAENYALPDYEPLGSIMNFGGLAFDQESPGPLWIHQLYIRDEEISESRTMVEARENLRARYQIAFDSEPTSDFRVRHHLMTYVAGEEATCPYQKRRLVPKLLGTMKEIGHNNRSLCQFITKNPYLAEHPLAKVIAQAEKDQLRLVLARRANPDSIHVKIKGIEITNRFFNFDEKTNEVHLVGLPEPPNQGDHLEIIYEEKVDE